MRGGEKVIVQHRKRPGSHLYTDVGIAGAHTVTADGRGRFTISVPYLTKPVQIKAELVELIYRPSERLYRATVTWMAVCAKPTRGIAGKSRLAAAHRAWTRAVAFEARGVSVPDVPDAWAALRVLAAAQAVDDSTDKPVSV